MEELEKIREYILEREPIFHHREFTNSRQDVENETTEDYFEISASGCEYTREFVINFLEERYKTEFEDEMIKEKWEVKDFKIKKLAPKIYLVNYTLFGQGRITKRGEIWQGDLKTGLKVMYHQGTVVVPVRQAEHKTLERKYLKKFGVTIATCIIVLKKNKTDNKVLFIDASFVIVFCNFICKPECFPFKLSFDFFWS